jgi:nucleotide-binding universal stress UspA family protein
MRNILVPLDGSAFAEQVLPLATGLAHATAARLRLVTVHGLGSSEELLRVVVDSRFITTLAAVEEEYLTKLSARIREEHDLEVDAVLLPGSNVRVLSAYVRREAIDLVVMSTHGRRGMARAWLGSVADALIRQVTVPVLLVRPDSGMPSRPATDRIRRVLVALDGSTNAEAALDAAEEICRAQDSECVLVRVVTPPIHPISPSLEHTARYLRDYVDEGRAEAARYLASVAAARSMPMRHQVCVDHQPARAIVDLADEIEADLIAVGTRGAGAIGRMLVGSVADRVARGASVPVLICHGAGVEPSVSELVARAAE